MFFVRCRRQTKKGGGDGAVKSVDGFSLFFFFNFFLHFVLFYFIVNRKLCFSSLHFSFFLIANSLPFISCSLHVFIFFPCEKGPFLDGPGGFVYM